LLVGWSSLVADSRFPFGPSRSAPSSCSGSSHGGPSRVDLPRADLSRPDLSEPDLSEADLSEADLAEAKLSEAKQGRIAAPASPEASPSAPIPDGVFPPMNRSALLCTTLMSLTIAFPLSTTSLASAQMGQDGARDRARDSERDRTPARDGQTTRQRGAETDAIDLDDPRWQDRLPRDDRAALNILIGYEAPKFADDLQWFHGEKTTLEALRGKVVVIQSFNARGARALPQRLVANVGDHRDDGLVLLALHTPENADRAGAMLERMELDLPLLLDTSGVTSDRFGIFRRPVNVVIDRTGNVRFAGLNDRGIAHAVEALLAEEHDPNAKPRVREAAAEPTEVTWPTFTTPLGRVRDLRGQESPPFHVGDWIKDEDSPRGRLTIIDFWATWCRPCIAAIPHMNQIAQHYGDRVFIVGISDESRGAFNRGMAERNLRTSGFEYSLALDTERRMANAFGVQSIPNIAVISGDGIVRWQGHPNALTRDVMDQLVAANEQLRGVGGDGATPVAPPRRWQQQQRARN